MFGMPMPPYFLAFPPYFSATSRCASTSTRTGMNEAAFWTTIGSLKVESSIALQGGHQTAVKSTITMPFCE